MILVKCIKKILLEHMYINFMYIYFGEQLPSDDDRPEAIVMPVLVRKHCCRQTSPR